MLIKMNIYTYLDCLNVKLVYIAIEINTKIPINK